MSKNDKTLSEKIAELQEYVSWFEGEDFEVEKSLDKYKQAEALADEIKKDLDGFRNEISVVKKKFDQ
jgi:exodeoxyribonuclease VII small subunit